MTRSASWYAPAFSRCLAISVVSPSFWSQRVTLERSMPSVCAISAWVLPARSRARSAATWFRFRYRSARVRPVGGWSGSVEVSVSGIGAAHDPVSGVRARSADAGFVFICHRAKTCQDNSDSGGKSLMGAGALSGCTGGVAQWFSDERESEVSHYRNRWNTFMEHFRRSETRKLVIY